jgi:hypothetical protein
VERTIKMQPSPISIVDAGKGRAIEQFRADLFQGKEGQVGRVMRYLEEIEAKLDAVAQESAARLSRMEAKLTSLVQQHTLKEFYTTDDLCKMFGRAPYTVREWCRLGRIKARKVAASCGGECEWRVPHEEVVRLQNEGLLPMPAKY